MIRVLLHVAEGVLTTTFVFPWIDRRKRHALIRRWSRRLLRIMHIVPRMHGVLFDGIVGNGLIVANHISWIDIFVIHALEPSRFIAKSELQRWPFVGRMMRDVGTLFIARDSRRHTHDIKEQVAQSLAAGDVIAIFPEGTTSDGKVLLPFHSSLLQPIVDVGGRVQPIAIRYLDMNGRWSDAPAYVGATTLLQSFWRMTAEPALTVELHLLPAMSAQSRHRRELTRTAEESIRTALRSPAGGSELETRAHHRA